MTPVDHRKPPTRAARRQPKSSARRGDPQPRRPRKAQRSHSAIGASIVAVAAIVAVSAFILTRGTSSTPGDDGLRMGSGTDTGAAAPAQTSDGNTTKADRNPPSAASSGARPAPKTQPSTSTPPPVNTGPVSPAFKRGQWIAVLDKYPSDTGMNADQVAKNLAVKLANAGIPAKAMLVNGQYPGLVNSSLERITSTWLVYLGPGPSSAQMLDLCSDPRTQAAYPSPACPTYEPAAAPGG